MLRAPCAMQPRGVIQLNTRVLKTTRLLYDFPIGTITSFQTVVVSVLLAHVGVLFGLWLSPVGFRGLLALNAMMSLAVLVYAASRARLILAAHDWSYLTLIAFELLALAAAAWALRGSRTASICSSVVFGLHVCVSIAAIVYAFAFKMNRLM